MKQNPLAIDLYAGLAGTPEPVVKATIVAMAADGLLTDEEAEALIAEFGLRGM